MRRLAMFAALAACAGPQRTARSPEEDLHLCAYVVEDHHGGAVRLFRGDRFVHLAELPSLEEAAGCDAIAKLHGGIGGSRTNMGDGYVEVVSAYTGSPLLRTETYSSWGGAALEKAGDEVYNALAPGTPLHTQLLAERGRAPKPVEPAEAAPAASAARGILAVLELRNKLPPAARAEVDGSYFADLIRTAALRRAPGLHVMTRENLLVLLQASGRKLEDCEGECEVETGRRVGADLVVSGEILRVGQGLRLNLKLHEAASGRLLSGAVAAGASPNELETATQRSVLELFAPFDAPPETHVPSRRPPAAAESPAPQEIGK